MLTFPSRRFIDKRLYVMSRHTTSSESSDAVPAVVLDYARPRFRRRDAWAVAGSFLGGILVGGMVANVGYSWLLNQNPSDDSLAILFALQGILSGSALVLYAAAAWFHTRGGRAVLVRPVAVPAVVGAVYGTIPALCFVCSDAGHSSAPLRAGGAMLIALVPLVLPLWMFHGRRGKAGGKTREEENR